MTAPEFVGWDKTPRLFRDCIITEKIDGTNGAVIISEDGDVWAQSKNRMLYAPGQSDNPKGTDNAGFRVWVEANAVELAATLGPGRHFGEWWGSGIQRGYGLTNGEKRFSLFNTNKWDNHELGSVSGLGVVPVLSQGTFNTNDVTDCLEFLIRSGSQAALGYMTPEGVCVYHTASRSIFKATCLDDAVSKTEAGSALASAMRWRPGDESWTA